MTGSSPVMTGLDRCMRYLNIKGGWYNTQRGPHNRAASKSR
jgi:hypothetical protein